MTSLPDATVRSIAPAMAHGISAAVHVLLLATAALTAPRITYDDATLEARFVYAAHALAAPPESGDSTNEGLSDPEMSALVERNVTDQATEIVVPGKPLEFGHEPNEKPSGPTSTPHPMLIRDAKTFASFFWNPDSPGRGDRGMFDGTAPPQHPQAPQFAGGAKPGPPPKPETRLCPPRELGKTASLCRRIFLTVEP